MTFAEHLAAIPVGASTRIWKAKLAYMRERRWRDDDWYRAWRAGELPREVEGAIVGGAP